MELSTIGLCVGVFYIGLLVGMVLHKWLASRRVRSGTIFITVNPDKTLFSLELTEEPDSLIGMDEVIFKVELSEADRE